MNAFSAMGKPSGNRGAISPQSLHAVALQTEALTQIETGFQFELQAAYNLRVGHLLLVETVHGDVAFLQVLHCVANLVSPSNVSVTVVWANQQHQQPVFFQAAAAVKQLYWVDAQAVLTANTPSQPASSFFRFSDVFCPKASLHPSQLLASTFVNSTDKVVLAETMTSLLMQLRAMGKCPVVLDTLGLFSQLALPTVSVVPLGRAESPFFSLETYGVEALMSECIAQLPPPLQAGGWSQYAHVFGAVTQPVEDLGTLNRLLEKSGAGLLHRQLQRMEQRCLFAKRPQAQYFSIAQLVNQSPHAVLWVIDLSCFPTSVLPWLVETLTQEIMMLSLANHPLALGLLNADFQTNVSQLLPPEHPALQRGNLPFIQGQWSKKQESTALSFEKTAIPFNLTINLLAPEGLVVLQGELTQQLLLVLGLPPITVLHNASAALDNLAEADVINREVADLFEPLPVSVEAFSAVTQSAPPASEAEESLNALDWDLLDITLLPKQQAEDLLTLEPPLPLLEQAQENLDTKGSIPTEEANYNSILGQMPAQWRLILERELQKETASTLASAGGLPPQTEGPHQVTEEALLPNPHALHPCLPDEMVADIETYYATTTPQAMPETPLMEQQAQQPAIPKSYLAEFLDAHLLDAVDEQMQEAYAPSATEYTENPSPAQGETSTHDHPLSLHEEHLVTFDEVVTDLTPMAMAKMNQVFEEQPEGFLMDDEMAIGHYHQQQALEHSDVTETNPLAFVATTNLSIIPNTLRPADNAILVESPLELNHSAGDAFPMFDFDISALPPLTAMLATQQDPIQATVPSIKDKVPHHQTSALIPTPTTPAVPRETTAEPTEHQTHHDTVAISPTIPQKNWDTLLNQLDALTTTPTQPQTSASTVQSVVPSTPSLAVVVADPFAASTSPIVNPTATDQEPVVVNSLSVVEMPSTLVNLAVGNRVRHDEYGVGTVQAVVPLEDRSVVSILFDLHGRRLLDPTLSALYPATQ
jgi:hypothetical protein